MKKLCRIQTGNKNAILSHSVALNTAPKVLIDVALNTASKVFSDVALNTASKVFSDVALNTASKVFVYDISTAYCASALIAFYQVNESLTE